MRTLNITPTIKPNFTSVSAIIVGEKPSVGLEAKPSANPNEMNRLIGYLKDGSKVIVAQRPGKGGVDFNKLVGGKVYAVVADGFSPVFEKGEDKKPTSVQKTEDGLPLYSASGFYLLSSRQYPALMLTEGFTRIIDDGEKLLLIQPEQFAQALSLEISGEMELDILSAGLAQALSDENNLLAGLVETANKKRRILIRNAEMAALDDELTYDGVTYNELNLSIKDGNPFVLIAYQKPGEPVQCLELMREVDVTNQEMITTTHYHSVEQTMERFHASALGQLLVEAVLLEEPVKVVFVQGHLLRSSVSFRRRIKNVIEAPPQKAQYGDGTYIKGALTAWTKGFVNILHSMHPNFPERDYEALYFVAASRQAEIGLNKKEGKWTPPFPLPYDLVQALIKT